MTIDAFILVGGRSTRFGRNKATTAFGGKPMAERIAGIVVDALPDARVTLVAAEDNQFPPTALSFPVIFDLYSDRGPIGGLHAALAYARSDWIVVVACDLPMISAALISRLTAFINDDLDAIVPLQPDGKPQPLCAVYRVDNCLEIVETMLENRSAPAVRAVAEAVRTRYVVFSEFEDLPGAADLFANVNRPADLDAASQLVE